jgi:Ankyrin repeats (3 copies)
MQVLLEHRMDQDTLDLKNDALIVAAENGHYQVLKLLILAGANVDFRNNNRDPVLLRATRSGHVGVVRVLLENGADVDIKGTEKQTALEIEVRKITPAKGKQVTPNRDMKSHEEMVKLYLEYDAEVSWAHKIAQETGCYTCIRLLHHAKESKRRK